MLTIEPTDYFTLIPGTNKKVEHVATLQTQMVVVVTYRNNQWPAEKHW